MAKTNITYLEWEAPEFRRYDKSFGWYALLFLIILILASYQAITGDYFGAVSMVILGVLIALFANRKPPIVKISLNKEGLGLGDLFIPYRHFKHFWIVDTEEHKTLNLEASTYLKQTIIIELMDQDPEEIREILIKHVAEGESAMPSFSQRIAHKLKF